VTGDIHYVDCGYHIISMPHLSALKAAEDAQSAAPEPGGASRSL
jgi:enoyl-[acyl-carrier protein] reductase I